MAKYNPKTGRYEDDAAETQIPGVTSPYAPLVQPPAVAGGAIAPIAPVTSVQPWTTQAVGTQAQETALANQIAADPAAQARIAAERQQSIEQARMATGQTAAQAGGTAAPTAIPNTYAPAAPVAAPVAPVYSQPVAYAPAVAPVQSAGVPAAPQPDQGNQVAYGNYGADFDNLYGALLSLGELYEGTQGDSSVGTGDATQAAAFSEYGPGADLRASQISPIADERLQNTRSAVDARRRNIDTFEFSPFEGINAEGDQRTTDADAVLGDMRAAINSAQLTPEALASRGDVSSQLGKVLGGPDRRKIALDSLKLFDEQTAPQVQQGIRDIGRGAAAFGRLNSGLTTNELTDFGLTRGRDRDRLERTLANDAAQQEMADALSRLGAAQSVSGQFRGEDTSAANLALSRAGALGGLSNTLFGRGQALRDEARGERSARLGYDQAKLGADTSALNTLAGIEGQQFAQSAQERGELRGERGYQNEMNREALDNRIRQLTLEDALTNSEFGREQSRLNSTLPYAFGDSIDPTRALLTASQGGGEPFDLGPLLAQYYERMARQGVGTKKPVQYAGSGSA